jgi:3-hydroxy acid dehydrogenase / malonic semialdehyde reductase
MSRNPICVVITGASAGIGEAVAKRFARDGYHLFLLARRQEKLEALKRELACPVDLFSLDVKERESVDEVFRRIEENHSIDILVNNAGLALGLDPAQRASLDDWEEMIDCNIKGLTYCTRAVLPGMVARNRGHVINLGSVAGTYPYPGGNVYGATKAYVHQFSLNLRADLLGTEVRVTCIEPGLVGQTELSFIRFKGDAERAKNLYAKTAPLLPEDIAEAIFWCASLPRHVNINAMELMPVCQASAALAVSRDGVK